MSLIDTGGHLIVTRDTRLRMKNTLRMAEDRFQRALGVGVTTEPMTSACLCPGRPLDSHDVRRFYVFYVLTQIESQFSILD